MKKIALLTLMWAVASGVSAKEIQDPEKLLELNEKENQAHFELERAEQAALTGDATDANLKKLRDRYNRIKEELDAMLAKQPDRATAEEFLINSCGN